jgi:hypothetical protein
MLHTDIPNRLDVEALATTREPGCVSLYLPAGNLPAEADQAKIKLKNLLRTAVEQLVAAGTPADIVGAITASVEDLIGDREFWRYQSTSLAVFVTATSRTTYRLPSVLVSAIEVSDRFYIKPLLRAITFPQAALVLALAQNSVRLIEISADQPANRLEIDDLPEDVADAVGLQSVRGRSADSNDRGGRVQGDEGHKVRMREYAQAIIKAIRPKVVGTSRPMILAGAEPLVSIYRSVSTHPRLTEAVIAGNPEDRSDEQLAAAARPILDALYASELDAIKERFGSNAAHGRAVTDLTDIARAATGNAIDTLLFDMDHSISGSIDETSGAITFDDKDDAINYGVVDEIVRRALLSGAKVFAVREDDVPGGGGVAAMVRFPS